MFPAGPARSFLAIDEVSIPTGVTVVIPMPSDRNLPASNPVNPLPSPENFVAVSVPSAELKVRLVPLFGARLPVASVVNKTLHDVSDDSSATVT